MTLYELVQIAKKSGPFGRSEFIHIRRHHPGKPGGDSYLTLKAFQIEMANREGTWSASICSFNTELYSVYRNRKGYFGLAREDGYRPVKRHDSLKEGGNA